MFAGMAVVFFIVSGVGALADGAPVTSVLEPLAVGPWLVLTAWAAGGILLSMVGHFRESGGAVPEPEASNPREREPLVTA